ncbi:MAG: phenylalanine--tRNA ligase subunit beta, partial [Sphingobacterium sp.]
GMLCGEDEIGLGTSHAGIIELSKEAVIGTDVKSYYKMEDDYCYEIGLTPNRADAASHLGVARDLAAYFRTELKEIDSISLVDLGVNGTKVEVTSTIDAPRYSGVNIKNIKVGESPEWLRNKLNAIGIRSINNVVDVTNYILHDLGQPLHAFDVDKIAGNQILVRKAKSGELFKTLDGIERVLTGEDLVIADSEKPMCLAGIFGGLNSGVTEDTTAIFLESAYFHPVTVRKSSKRHGLKTDSSFRFERGTNPDITIVALKKAVKILLEVTGGEVSSNIIDIYPNKINPFEFAVNYQNIQRVIGKDIPYQTIKEIIVSLGIDLKNETDEGFDVLVPPFKVDVTREIDIIEEVLRIYGYNNIELKSQIKASLNTSEKPDKEVVLNQISDFLIGNSYREILTNSLTKTDFLENENTAVKLVNPLSNDLDVMRQNLLFSALTSIGYNQKRKNADIKVFEYGRSYHLIEDNYIETQLLALAIAGRKSAEQWNSKSESLNFYDIKSAVDGIVARLKIENIRIEDYQGEYFSYGLSYKKGEKILVSFGAVSQSNLKKADVDGSVFFAQFDWDLVMKVIRKNKITFKEVSKFPSVRRDLALLLDEQISFDQLCGIARKTEKNI